MVRRLLAAGHAVTVWNRTFAKAQALADAGALPVAQLGDAVRDAGIVISMLEAGPIVAQVMHDALPSLAPHALWVDMSSTQPAEAQAFHALLQGQGHRFVDAPVSGGQAGAENGKLSIMCGGSVEAMAKAEPFMQAYALRVVHVGEAGAGQTTKMCNQIAIAGVIQGVAESLRFAQNSGLDLDKVFEAISGGAAQSWQMVNRWPTMAKDEFDFGFAVDWMRKDLGLALDEARRNGAVLPVAALVDQFYADVQAMGGARQDTSALVRRLPK